MSTPRPPLDLANLLTYLISNTQLAGQPGLSDDLNRALVAGNAQRFSAMFPAWTQLMAQDQNFQGRWTEIMGSAPVSPSAALSPAEFARYNAIRAAQAQQDAAGLPHHPNDDAELAQYNNKIAQTPGTPTDANRKWQAELKAQVDIQNQRARQEFANMMGYAVDANGNLTANPTLARDQLRQAQTEAAAERAQQITMENLQQGGRTAMERLQQEGRLALQTGQQGWQTQERLGTQQFTAGQNDLERQLRRDLQAGVLNQQEREFARNYLIQQGEQRGYVMDANGNPTSQLTEGARAAREQERTQRAALAAQLMQAPKDVFRAGAYFRNMAGQGSSPYTMGLGGGGIAGFNSMGQRGEGTPGSATLEDVEAMPGMAPGPGMASASPNPQAMQAMSTPGPAMQAQAVTGTPEALAPAETDDDSLVPGSQPAGPTGRKRSRSRDQLNTELDRLLGGASGRGLRGQGPMAAMERGQSQRRPAERSTNRVSRAENPQQTADLMKWFRAMLQAQAPQTPTPQNQARANATRFLELMGGTPAAAGPLPEPAPQRAMPGLDVGTLRTQEQVAPTEGGAQDQIAQLLGGQAGGGTDAVTGWQQAPSTQTQQPAEEGGAGFGMGGGIGSEPSTSSESQSPSALGGSTSNESGSEENALSIPGMAPAGPVDDPLTALISGQLGMGAGGSFQSRAEPDGTAPGAIPYVDPSVLLDPEVQAMVRDVRQQGVRDDTRQRQKRRGNRPSGPAGPQGEALIYDAQEADRRRWSDERFLQGLSSLNRRGVLGRPGSGPAGPGDLAAPLVPEEGGTAMPTVPTPASVGAVGSSFNMAAAPPPAPGLGGMDAGNQDSALNYMSDFLINGVGNQDPQFLQKMSRTQRGITEGALQALGLSWEDFTEAVAQTRFNNVGNVLSA